jgi:hypothetical protein
VRQKKDKPPLEEVLTYTKIFLGVFYATSFLNHESNEVNKNGMSIYTRLERETENS